MAKKALLTKAEREAALKSYNPANQAPLRLLEIPKKLNPFAENVKIYASMLSDLKGDQVKYGSAYHMLEKASSAGLLNGVEIVEASSGNFGAALARLGPFFSPDIRVTVYVSPSTPEKKIEQLRQNGAKVVVTKNGVAEAHAKGKENGYLNLNQYGDDANPNFFYEHIGPQIWNGTEKEVDIFYAGLGTTGTMVGISRYLKEQRSTIQTVGIIVAEDNIVPGVRTLERLGEVQHSWREAVNRTRFGSAEDSYRESEQLIHESKGEILAGPSAGFAFQGLIADLTALEARGELARMRSQNNHRKVVAVFAVPDGPKPYLEEYKKYGFDMSYLDLS